MSRAARSVLRKIGFDAASSEDRPQQLEREANDKTAIPADPAAGQPNSGGLDAVPDEMLSEWEKRHEK